MEFVKAAINLLKSLGGGARAPASFLRSPKNNNSNLNRVKPMGLIEIQSYIL